MVPRQRFLVPECPQRAYRSYYDEQYAARLNPAGNAKKDKKDLR
jgi:hypothetical protein